MSGGSFEYLYYKRDGGIIDNLEQLEAMERYCRENDFHDAADELYQYILLVKTCQRRMNKQADYLQGLMHAIEWECSGDWGRDSVIEATKKLLEDESK